GVNAAVGSNVGITAFSSDVDGGAITYTLTDNDSGHFAINTSTGVVTLANGAGLTLGLHTIVAQAHTTRGAARTADSLTQTFTIDVVANQPVIDLDANNSSGAAGSDYAATFTESVFQPAIGDFDTTISEPGFTNLVSATITLENAQDGDSLNIGA